VSRAAEQLVQRIHREGPIPFDAFVEAALYGDGGFFTRARGAGRAGRDFVTSPEVGTLFGALVARALDRWWTELEQPDPFLVVDAGAGRGRLAADVLAAAPACAPALRYVLVERSESLLAAQHELLTLEPFEDVWGPMVRTDADAPVPVTGMGPIATALSELPTVRTPGVVIANELFDNLPFRIVERTPREWLEVRIGVEAHDFVEVLVPAADELATEADLVANGAVPAGARIPVPTALPAWFRRGALALHGGVLVIIDYCATVAELVERGSDGWLRTYRDHGRGASPLVGVGEQDITIDVPLEYLVHAAARAGFGLRADLGQAEWLRDLGLEELVDDARARWDARAGVGDLEAMRHRSRISEAAALTDVGGLGAHRVLVFSAG
jgi:NADH dehydrogenase [ubiquinone] 1 alpha subcomplex assembly factor 7